MTEGLPFWNATASGPGAWGMQPRLGVTPTVGGRNDKRLEVTRQWWKGKWGGRGRGSGDRSGDDDSRSLACGKKYNRVVGT